MPDFSWVPGLPSLEESRDLWFVDPNPEDKTLDKYGLVFEVRSSGSGRLVANRYQSSVTIDPPGHVKEVTTEKQHIEVDDEVLLVKEFQFTQDRETGQTLPDDVVGVELPPAQMEI